MVAISTAWPRPRSRVETEQPAGIHPRSSPSDLRQGGVAARQSQSLGRRRKGQLEDARMELAEAFEELKKVELLGLARSMHASVSPTMRARGRARPLGAMRPARCASRIQFPDNCQIAAPKRSGFCARACQRARALVLFGRPLFPLSCARLRSEVFLAGVKRWTSFDQRRRPGIIVSLASLVFEPRWSSMASRRATLRAAVGVNGSTAQ